MTDFTCEPANCGIMNDIMFDYIDGELNESDKEKFDEHLLTCELCRKEFESRKNLILNISDARYNLESSLSAALVPQIKQIKRQNFLKTFGTITAAAAVFVLVTLAYFNPFVNKVTNDMALNETLQMNFDIMAYGAIEEAAVEIEIAEARSYNSPAPEVSIVSPMFEYLSLYAPEYVDTTSVLYICYTNIEFPKEVVVVTVKIEPNYTANIVRNTNFEFNIEAAEVYTDSVEKPYIVIIEFYDEVN